MGNMSVKWYWNGLVFVKTLCLIGECLAPFFKLWKNFETFIFCCTSFCSLVFNLLQDSEPDVIDGVGAETGHVIRTTIGGRNGQVKQVESKSNCRMWKFYMVLWS